MFQPMKSSHRMQYLKGRFIPLVEENVMMILTFFSSGKDPLFISCLFQKIWIGLSPCTCMIETREIEPKVFLFNRGIDLKSFYSVFLWLFLDWVDLVLLLGNRNLWVIMRVEEGEKQWAAGWSFGFGWSWLGKFLWCLMGHVSSFWLVGFNSWMITEER